MHVPDRRTFLAGCKSACPDAKGASGLEELGPVLRNAEIRTSTRMSGKRVAAYVDDVIWCLRDLTRTKPKSVWDVPYFKMLKECHDRYGMKVQLNLFYRA